MIEDRAGLRRRRAALLVALPLAAALVALLLGGPGSTEPDLGRAMPTVEAAFRDLLVELRGIADMALTSSIERATERARRSPVLAGRIEGLGLLDAELEWVAWRGRPSAPLTPLTGAGAADWSVRLDGARTRLVARAGPDSEGRIALITLILASDADGLRPGDLLPPRVLRGLRPDFTFVEAASDAAGGAPVPGALTPPAGFAQLRLESPSGDLLGTVRLAPAPFERNRSRRLARAASWVLLTLIALAAVLVPWSRIVRAWPGCAAALAAIVAARWALIRLDTAALLLPADLGGPRLYGTTSAAGALASPADLLLTGVAVYLICLALRECLLAWGGGRGMLGPGAGAAAAALATWLVVSVVPTLARDSQLPLLDRRALYGGDVRVVLLVGLVLMVLGAAELWGLSFSRVHRRAGDPPRVRRLGVAVAAVLLAAGCSARLQSISLQLALDRLGTEYAQQVLHQGDRREKALLDAVGHVRDSYAGPDHPMPAFHARDKLLAYGFWVSSELFNAGYRSSLDFFTSRGAKISSFSFGLAGPLPDPAAPAAGVPNALRVDREVATRLGGPEHLIHAEVPVYHDGQFLGTVVGHVQDEPDNLPFLPRARPYLAALGAGPPRFPDTPYVRDPDYVLYDDNGHVRVSTLAEPPAPTDALRQAGARRATVDLVSNGERFVGLALADAGRLHLLLVPTRTRLERVAASVRLALLAALMLGLLAALPRLLRPARWPELLAGLRHSFYRKLLATTLVASVVPLLGLALFLRGYVERRGDDALNDAAIQSVRVAQRTLQDVLALEIESAVRDEAGTGPASAVTDTLLHWLQGLVGQEIHVFAGGRLVASSARELFDSGLLPERLDGEVHERLVDDDLPYVVRTAALGTASVPVAYAPLRVSDPRLELIVAVPVVLEQSEIARATDRLIEVILLATVLFVGLLAFASALVARAVARPVREMVAATAQIAAGDYAPRLSTRGEDELGQLVERFNGMASALARQRGDLEARREYMERLLSHATTGVISTDTGGRVVTQNPAARLLLDPGGAMLHTGAELVRALESLPGLRPLARALAAEPRQGGQPVDVDLESGEKPRRLRFVRIHLRDGLGVVSGSLILVDDVTELMRSNQLDAWAEMARAIAHEIKNPLTPIQLSTDHLRRLLRDRGLLPSPEIEACLDTVGKQVRALREIAGEFSAFAKLPALAPEPSDPVTLMREVIAPYRAAHPPGVRIVESYDGGDAHVLADRKVLARGLVNLVENALQAMPDGGTLTASVDRAPGAAEVAFTVEDTGLGLSAEAKRRLFEPYFSTKSSGTGLGLAIVHRAVEVHRGRIEVESEPGRGTTVRILLPVTSA